MFTLTLTTLQEKCYHQSLAYKNLNQPIKPFCVYITQLTLIGWLKTLEFLFFCDLSLF